MDQQEQTSPISRLHFFVATRRRIALLVCLCVFAVLHAARDAIISKVVQSNLHRVPGVEVSLSHLHLHWLLNGITLEGVEVFRPADANRKGPGGRRLRLAQVTHIEVRWPWRRLVRGGLVCDVDVEGVDATLWRIAKMPKLKPGDKAPKKVETEMTPPPPEAESIVAAWPEIARFVLPMGVDRVDVKNARFWLRDCTTDPEVKWVVDGIELEGKNLTNREHLADGHYATVDARALPAGGKWKMHMELDPMARSPTFGLRSQVENVVLAKVNTVLRAYAKLDVESGVFNTQLEVTSEKGKFKGFIEPHILNLKIRPRARDEAEDTLLNRAWRTAARVVTSLVENSKEQAIATRLPLAGEFVSPEIGVWDALTTLFGNAYLEALKPPVTPSDALPLLKPKPAKAEQAPGEPVVADASKKQAASPTKPAPAAKVTAEKTSGNKKEPTKKADRKKR